MKKQQQVIIYDFDGTIADTLDTVFAMFNRFAHELGFKKIAPDDIPRLRGKKTKELLQELEIPLFKLPWLIKKAQKELEKEIENVSLIEGIREVILNLKKREYALGILTSNHETNVHLFLKKYDFDIFDFIYSGSSIFGKDKIFKKLLKEKGLRASEITYVGDETRDIEAAKKVGVKIIAVTWGYNTRTILEKEKPDLIVDSPNELLRIFSD